MAGFNTYGRITLRLITLRITDHAEYVSPAKDLQVLVEIVHSGSFSAAVATLGQTPAFVTKRIQILESTLGVTLLSCSARGVALTESGQRCYEHAKAILAGYQHLVDDVTQLKTRPAGMILYRL